MRYFTFIPSLFLLVLVVAAPHTAGDDVSWELLSEVEYTSEDGQWVIRFSENVQQYDGRRVTLEGFMMPLDHGTQQRHFILSAYPVSHCFFCIPGGPESIIEVRADEGVRYTPQPITITGTLRTLEDEPMGMLYRLDDATSGR